MAANIEQIFQDFILNKIREIEDQHEDTSCVEPSCSGSDNIRVLKAVSEREKQEEVGGSSSQKKHKKHKKHKSKKKKRKRGKEEKESSSESGPESEGGTQHQPRFDLFHRRGTPTEENKEQGDDGEGKSRRHKRHMGGKRKKKKRRKDGDKSSSDSDFELESKQKNSKGVYSSSRQREDLPDIIPKQDSSNKGGGQGERDSKRRRQSHSHSRSHSRSRSLSRSRSARRSHRSRSRHRHRRSRTRFRSRSQHRRTRSRSRSGRRSRRTCSKSPRSSKDTAAAAPPPPPNLISSTAHPLGPPSDSSTPPTASIGGWKPLPLLEDIGSSRSSERKDESLALDESTRCSQTASAGLQPPQLASSYRGHNIGAEELIEASTELQKAEQSDKSGEEKKEEAEDATEKPAAGPAASHSSLTQSRPLEADQATETTRALENPNTTSVTTGKSLKKKRRTPSKSPQKKKETKSSSKRRKRSKSASRSHRRRSRSKSPSWRKRSRSRSRSRSMGRRSRRSQSRSGSRGRRRATYSQRDRWKREPSHSPVLILRKNRSPNRKHRSASSSPPRITELDKDQLLEIAKANAAAMCAKAGMPIPASLRPTVLPQLPLALPSMAMNAAMASMTAATMTAALSSMGALASLPPLPSITNKPPPGPPQPNMAALEEVKKKVAKQANSISIKEFTDKCKMIVDSKGELPVAVPHVSDEEDDGKPFGTSALREQKAISFSINNMSVRPAVRSDAGMAKEFPVSSGSQHRKKEGEAPGAYGEWVPVDKAADKINAAATSSKAPTPVPMATTTSLHTEAAPATGLPAVTEEPIVMPAKDSVFPDPPLQPVDISQAVTERIKAQRRLAENPYDVSAICMLSRAQEQVDAWAQSNTIPGLFTGSTGAQVLSSEELSTSGPQAWLKKDQFLRAAPVSGGVGEFLMRKMGWKTGEGLGRNREGTVEPIIIDFKIDRKGLVAEGEKPQKQTGGLVVTKDLMGKHPVSALIELCNKRRMMQPDFVMVHHSGPDHRKNFLFKVTVNGVDYQPQTASPNKKHAKAMAATVALQALGEVPVDGPGLYTGPVFTAASTGPLFST
ncbi:protein SON isoform X3 [Myripristis murdjan]|uniref:protein SON isoform X3 n=1 Tax=Myripristis murdjan TaxID=586833 RepID=UPI001176229A|nr:protein SON isoform X3 [Myripristis murdjan]